MFSFCKTIIGFQPVYPSVYQVLYTDEKQIRNSHHWHHVWHTSIERFLHGFSVLTQFVGDLSRLSVWQIYIQLPEVTNGGDAYLEFSWNMSMTLEAKGQKISWLLPLKMGL